ncbi:hypothetical protein ND16A_0829 [Thalassotalea sp. ND16A]|nr:hypothetical protein ND16A_0829 [Thalassotalea sp. ND16A]
MGGISIWQLLIVFAIIVLLFGTKKLRNIGGDLGSAVKGFKKAIGDDKAADKEVDKEPEQLDQKQQSAEQSTDQSTKTKEKDQA